MGATHGKTVPDQAFLPGADDIRFEFLTAENLTRASENRQVLGTNIFLHRTFFSLDLFAPDIDAMHNGKSPFCSASVGNGEGAPPLR